MEAIARAVVFRRGKIFICKRVGKNQPWAFPAIQFAEEPLDETLEEMLFIAHGLRVKFSPHWFAETKNAERLYTFFCYPLNFYAENSPHFRGIFISPDFALKKNFSSRDCDITQILSKSIRKKHFFSFHQ